MLINLWNYETLTRQFMELYNISDKQMCNILKELFRTPNQDSVSLLCEQTGIELDYVSMFCEQTGFKLDEFDVANNIEFVGKIVSTTTDNFDYLKQAGLVPVDVLLEHDSPISRHLSKYGLEIKPSSQQLIYKGKQFYIPRNDKDCKYCAYEYKKCKFDNYAYKNMYCPYLQAINHLAKKLYHDNAEIEMFLIATREDMLSYSKVKYHPEIFDTIETLMDKLFGKKLKIGDEWEKEKQTTYIVTLNVKYKDMSYRSGDKRGTDGLNAINIYYDYKKYCNNTYDIPEEVPECFWDNIWIIQNCLRVIGSFGNSSGRIYAGINHSVTFPYEELNIELV